MCVYFPSPAGYSVDPVDKGSGSFPLGEVLSLWEGGLAGSFSTVRGLFGCLC